MGEWGIRAATECVAVNPENLVLCVFFIKILFHSK